MTKSAAVLLCLISALTSCASAFQREITSFKCPVALSGDEIEAFREEKYHDALQHEKLYSRAPRATPEEKDIQNLDYAYNIYIEDAENDNPIAQMLLGSLHGMYEYGDSPNQEMEYWFKESAQKGLVASQSLLGTLYTNGRGKIQSDELGLLWYECAASNGSTQAKEYLEALSE